MDLPIITIAAIDPGWFTSIVAVILGGGLVTAWSTFRKTPVEVESISVNTLRGVIEELRDELERKDRQLSEQNRVIGELRGRVETLESRHTG